MKIYGIDFTSAPGRKKAITYTQCELTAGRLSLKGLGDLTSFAEFERFLDELDPCVAGMDFPFGQPRKFIENAGWPRSWEGYTHQVAGMNKSEFVGFLETYCQGRDQGDKHHLRSTDKIAKSRSPMMLYRVPVGRMFFEGAPRLLKAGVCVRPCCVSDDPRVVVEAYPALIARRWIGSRSYKTDTEKLQTTLQHAAREEILEGLRSKQTNMEFGFDVRIEKEAARVMIHDYSGDRLDALMCAVQASWAYSQRERNFGIPASCDPLEGWIVDPRLSNGARL
jgi:hypothetical protein